MRTLRERLRRGLLAILARRRGEVRALQDLRHLGEIARLSGVFVATMLLPIAFLAFLALNSIRSEELSVDLDLQDRGRATTTQIQGELAGIFDRFEGAVLERIRRGESPTSNLGELSPYLRAAFRFDDDGALAAPFVLPEDADPQMPPIGWKRAARKARLLEPREPLLAAAAWREARDMSTQPAAIGESILGESRSLAAAGRYDPAEKLLTENLYGGLPTQRDERGFRFADLALLELSRQRFARGDTDMGSSNLFTLVELLLTPTSPWTIGREGEPAVLREALGLLEGRADPDWIAGSRSRLNELHAQLYWAELVKDEIELVYSRVPEGRFEYLGARDDSPAVWAIVRAGENTYTFSFSVEALYEHLKAIVTGRNALDEDLASHLYRSDDELPDTSLSVRLGPWLPVTLAVTPKDPVGLETQKRNRRTVRAAVVLTAVFVSVVGALWIARLIAWEVETARQRADFAANVSHELRSPITQIRLKGEALQFGLVDPGEDMQQHFDAIVRESERLSRLVDDVLDFAAIERGAKRYHPRPDDLGDVVASGVAAARASMEQAGMELEVDIQEDLPRVWIDREAIGQVITNLLSNALKYAVDGKWVRVRLHLAPDGVELSVADRGIGISGDELGRVFDDFFRSTDPLVRRTKGTGIGLAIVRYIVEAHGGTISVESTLGRGARFIVHLPLEPPAEAP